MRGSGTLAEKQEAMRRRAEREAQQRRIKPYHVTCCEQTFSTVEEAKKHRCSNGSYIEQQDRTKCITGCGRQARIGSGYCSRCSATKQIGQLRDRLPGMPVLPAGHLNPVELLPSTEEVMPSEAQAAGQTTRPLAVTGDQPSGERADEGSYENTTLPTTSEHNVFAPSSKEKTYTRSQISKIVGVSNTTLFRWEKKGVVFPHRLARTGQYMYTEEMLQKVIEYKNLEYVPPPQLIVPGSPAAMGSRTVNKAVKINKRMERAVANRLGSLGRRFL